MDRREIGFLAENIAARHLVSKGYRIIGQNYRKPWGEIDIIAENEGTIVFVEVKSNFKKYSDGFEPELRVNREKTSKIMKTADILMKNEFGQEEREWRIDIISVTFNGQERQDESVEIKHYENVAEAIF